LRIILAEKLLSGADNSVVKDLNRPVLSILSDHVTTHTANPSVILGSSRLRGQWGLWGVRGRLGGILQNRGRKAALRV